MANATTAPPTMMSAAAAQPSERIAPRRLFAFLIMVFGMFMSILDIQIVSASLNEIQAGLSASSSEVSWVQTAYLIAEVIAIPLSGFLSRALRHAPAVCDLRLRLHDRELPLRLCLHDRADDPVARDPGISGRRHDPDRVRVRLYGVSALEIPHRRPDHRPGRDAGADHRSDGRRHHHRLDVVALAVLHQRRSRHRHHHRRADAGRFRQAEFRAARPFRLVGPALHGGLSRFARICAGGRAAI